MSGENVTLDESLAGSSQQQLADAVETLRALLKQIDGDVQAVFSGWSGPAADAFGTAQGDWQTNTGQFNGRLDDVAVAVGQGNNIMGTLEEDNASALLRGTEAGLTSYTNLPG